MSRKRFTGCEYTILDSFLCRYKKLSGTVWTAAAHNWNKLFAHIERCTGAVGREGLLPWLQLLTSECLLPSNLFKSSLLLIYFRCVPNNLSQGGATCRESGKNLSNMWQSRFKICLAQLHSVTEMALKSLFCLVVDPGEGPRGPFPLPPPTRPPEHMDPPLLQC